MYKITIQTLTGSEHTIYVPGNEDYVVTSAVLSLSVGSVGEFNFTIPLGHPRYNEIVDHSIVTVYEDDAEIWRGEIRDIKQNFDKSLNVYCLEDMCWLGECAVAMTSITNQTYAQRFSAAIATYNTNQVAKRQFTAGILTSITTTNLCTWQPQYEEDLLTCLRNYIADDGYVRIRREYSGGVLTRYVDIVKLSDYGSQADQKIEFGSNLLDFVKEMDNTNFLNVIYPYGKETETPLYGEIMQRMVGTPQENAASIAAFGRRERSVIFETDSLARLNSLAQSYLNRYSQPNMKLEVRAVDLGDIEIVNRIRLGDSVRIIASPFGIDQWSYVTKQELNLLDIADNQITLADAVRVQSLTSQVTEQAKEFEKAQTPASILDEAKRNAWAIFEGDNGGIVTFQVNDSEQIIGIIIANNLDINQATKAWGWNVNGLVYVHRDYPTDDWQVGIAMTMNGEIVADYITTGTLDAAEVNVINLNADNIKSGSISANRVNFGTMQANRISGGSMVVGGVNNEEGTITSVANIEWDGNLTTLNQYDTATFAVGITVYEAVWLRVTATGQSTGNIVGRYRINSGAWQDLRVGDTLIGTFNTETYITVDALYHSLSFYKGLAIVKTYIDNSGVVADNLVARNSGYIGDLVINGREIYLVGDFIIAKKSYKGDIKKKILAKFVPSELYITDANFYISLTYSINHSPGDGYFFYLEYYSGGWQVAQYINQRFDEGTYTITFDNVTIQSNDTRKWRVRTDFSTLGVNSQFTATIYAPYIKTLSLSDDGNYGSFVGRFTGAGDFDTNTSIGNIEFDNSHIYVNDTTEYIDVAKSGFKSAENSSKYVEVTTAPKVAAFYSSSNYVHINAEPSGSYVYIATDSSNNHVVIKTNKPEIDVLGTGSYSYVKAYVDSSNNPHLKIKGDQYKNIDINKNAVELYADSNNDMWLGSGSDFSGHQNGSPVSMSWNGGSDRRLKENIKPIDIETAKAIIEGTEPQSFKYKAKDGKHYGMIAQDVRELLDNLGESDAVLEREMGVDDYRMLEYTEYVPLLVSYVKDLRAEITALKEEVRILKEEKNDGKH